MKQYIKINECRLCKSNNLKEILNLGRSPIGNDLLKKNDLKRKINKFPLAVNQCKKCGHHQLSVSINNSILYKKNYTYLTGTSEVFKKYLKDYSIQICDKLNLNKNDLVIDIGCNDGTLLEYFKKYKKCKVLGIDPSKKPTELAKSRQINVLNDFFTFQLSMKIKKKKLFPKLITSHNTFAHVEDLNDFFRGIDNICYKNTTVVIEIGYWLKVVQNNWYDTIYHEHHDFHSLYPLLQFFKKYSFNIIDFKITEPQGGSLMLILKKMNNFKIYKKIKKQVDIEKNIGLYKIPFYKKIKNNLQKSKDKINILLNNYHKNNKIICAYGSPTKSVTLLSYIKLNKNIIKNIYEDNILKCKLYNPYMKIPIIHSSNILNDNPDVILILSWNFAKSIIKKVKKKYDKKIIFVVPLPEPYIIQ